MKIIWADHDPSRGVVFINAPQGITETDKFDNEKENLDAFIESSMEELGDCLYGNTEETENIKKWIRESGRGFGS